MQGQPRNFEQADYDFPGGAEHHGFVPDAGGRDFASEQGIDDVMTPAGGESIGGNPPPPPYSEGRRYSSSKLRNEKNALKQEC